VVGQYQDPLLGSVLDGRYRVVQLLGRGGMGNVYLAEETRLKRRSALKVLHPHLTHDRAHVERFLREAQTIAQFEHPNIVDIFAYGEEPSGVVFFAMELLTGEDLDARIKHSDERPYSTHEACLWAIQIARAVAVVHEAGLIHRDLKVSNIFLARRRDGEEVVKLLDFGIARPEDGSELTATGVALGTPSYMSPEQLVSRSVDRRADIYSFGVLLFKLTTGRLPFSGDAMQVAIQHRETPPPPPSEVAPDAGISQGLERIILTAMAKRPGERYQSMQAVEAALIAVVEAEAPELLGAATRNQRPSTLSSMPPTRPVTGNHGQFTPIQNDAQVAEATPASVANRTGPTSAMVVPAAPPPSNRILYFVTGGSLLSAAVLLSIMMLRPGATNPPQAPSATAAAPPPAPSPSAPVVPAAPPEAPSVQAAIAPPPPAVQPVAQPDPPASDPSPTTEPPVKAEPIVPVPKPKPPAGDVPPAVKKPVDPLAQVAAKATKCRRKHKAVDGPKIAVTYWIGTDGLVRDARAAVADDLGDCLTQAVAHTQFEPKLALNKKLEL
jgi:serine/threonine protein kinase